MKSGPYIHVLNFFRNSDFVQQYCHAMNVQPEDLFKRLDELRILHLKYKKECELYSIYRNLILDKMNFLINDLERICNEFGFIVQFTAYGTTEYKKEIHAKYYYNSTDITDLIVHWIKRKPSHESSMQD